MTSGFWGGRGWRSAPCPQLREPPGSSHGRALAPCSQGQSRCHWDSVAAPLPPTTGAPVLCSPLQASGCLQAPGQASLWGPGTCSSDCKAGSSGKGEGGGRDTAGRPGACLWESEGHTEAGGSPGLRPPQCRAPHHLWTGACRRGQVLPWPGSCQHPLPLGPTPRRLVGTRNRVHLLTMLWAPCSGHKCLSLGPSSQGRLPMLACHPRGGERGGGTRGPGVRGGAWPTPRPQVLPGASGVEDPGPPAGQLSSPRGREAPCLN